MLILALIGFVVATAVSLLLLPRVERLAIRQGWVDRPDGERKLHASPTPSLGGVAIAFGAAAGFGAALLVAPVFGVTALGFPPVVYLSALLMVCVGLWDDLHGLGFKTKLAVEIMVAYALLLSNSDYLIDLTSVPLIGEDAYTHALFAIPITLAWIVGVMNAINLIDGIDGLAGGVSLIAFTSLAIAFGPSDATLLLVAVVMVGSLLGFLRHNFPPASIFMGDSGSLFIGFVLAVYTLSGSGHVHPLVALAIPVVALGLPVFDTILSMVRRFIGRQAIMAPDRDHIHHRMIERMSVRRATLWLYTVAIGFGAVAVAMSASVASRAPWLIGTAVVGAAAFATRLGYVRRPYTPPVLFDTAAGTDVPSEPVAETGTHPEIEHAAVASEALPSPTGDGAVVAAEVDAGREPNSSSDLTLSASP